MVVFDRTKQELMEEINDLDG